MAVSGNLVRDPRARRTRQRLQDALRKLLGEKPLDEILIQDVADAAEVNRATFYDHYSDKFDLFNDLIAADFQKLWERRKAGFAEGDAAGICAIVMAVGDFLQQIHGDHAACTRQVSSGPLIDAAITLAIRGIVLESLSQRPEGSPLPSAVMASLISGAIYNGVKETLSAQAWHAGEAALKPVVQTILSLLKK